MGRPTMILVVDTNKVYAKEIQSILSENLLNAVIDTASNVYEVRRRLQLKDYQLVLADLSVSMEEDEIKQQLDGISATVVLWSDIRRSGHTLKKPGSVNELSSVMSELNLGAA